MIAKLLHRLLLPALVAGFVANIIVYWMLGAEGALTDVRSMGVMAIITLVGLIIGGVPAYRMLAKRRLGPVMRMLMFLLAGFVTGGIIALFLAWTITDENIASYMKYGLAAGVIAALVWMAINFDLLKAPRAKDSAGANRG